MSRISDGERLGFNKPGDIVTALMFLRFGETFGETTLGSFYDCFKVYEYLNVENLGKASSLIATKNDTNMGDYKTDHSQIFFNFGRLILLALTDAHFEQRLAAQHENRHFYTTSDELRGMLFGILSTYCDFSHSQLRKLVNEFAPDNIDNTISPALYVKPYFEDGVLSLGAGEMLAVVATAAHYTLISFLMNNLENLKFKEIFKYGEEAKSFDGKSLIKTLQDSLDEVKLDSFFKLASIYNTILAYVERSIGKEFNDRFSIAFKAIGDTYTQVFDLRFDINPENIHDYVIDGLYKLDDSVMLLTRELVDFEAPIYIGDHLTDLRKMYLKQIYNADTSYSSVYNTILKDGITCKIDFDNIKNYTAVIDVAAYESLVKTAIFQYRQTQKTSKNDEYLQSFYQLKYIEHLISDVYKYWTTKKVPFKILGVDDMYVEVTAASGETYKALKDVNTIGYSTAYARAMEIINQINARYVEAYEMAVENSGKRVDDEPTVDEYYRKVESVKPSDYNFDTTEDCVRAYMSGKLPYLVTIGGINPKELTKYVAQEEIDSKKLTKLAILDKEFVSVEKSIIKSPFEVVKSGSFNTNIIDGTGGKDTASTLATIIKNCNNREICYLSR